MRKQLFVCWADGPKQTEPEQADEFPFPPCAEVDGEIVDAVGVRPYTLNGRRGWLLELEEAKCNE